MDDAKINVLIVEDEWITSEEIKEVLEKNGMNVVGQEDNASAALQVAKEKVIDIALLDINIKGDKDGIELAQSINEIRPTAIIFLTAFDDSAYLERAKKVVPSAYLVKPFQSKNLVISIEMAFNTIKNGQETVDQEESFIIDDRIFIKEHNLLVRIMIKEITHVEAVGSYCKIHAAGKSYLLSMNLKTFEHKLNDLDFIRVHRSYLVNATMIEAINGNLIYIKESKVPIGSSHRADVLQRFKIV